MACNQTKMQLWYPKRTMDEVSGNSGTQFKNTYMIIPEEKDDNIKCDRDSPASSLSLLSDTSDVNEEVIVDFLSEDDSSRVASSVVSDCDEAVEKNANA
ncbi:hypothetical protein NQ314_011876 [Rhamnusium bicolor]|uniref:Uncharacterized protein n=1 Tax=Rhamnusium bicolor TaxID=1586634 RepID=A0AAV8XEX5_9CUCU|nr:hypothetical protein NQ314_011876 [Rhamnusium bicolor]